MGHKIGLLFLALDFSDSFASSKSYSAGIAMVLCAMAHKIARIADSQHFGTKYLS